jgi:putative transposase
LLENQARRLEHACPSAAASLREGLEQTLTLTRLDLPERLERVLSSTNLIENLFSRVREIARRVKRWQGGTMILRWTAAGVLEAERNLRVIAHCPSWLPRCERTMPQSIANADLIMEEELPK